MSYKSKAAHRSSTISRPRQVLIAAAISSAIVGIMIWNFGYLVQFGSASRYPVEVATVAGYFIGFAINVGVPLAAYSLFKEARQVFSQLAHSH